MAPAIATNDILMQVKAALEMAADSDNTVDVYTVLLKVSATGTKRSLGVAIAVGGKIINISELVSQALGRKFDTSTNGVVVYGFGSDAGYELICKLERAVSDYADVKLVQKWLF